MYIVGYRCPDYMGMGVIALTVLSTTSLACDQLSALVQRVVKPRRREKREKTLKALLIWL